MQLASFRFGVALVAGLCYGALAVPLSAQVTIAVPSAPSDGLDLPDVLARGKQFESQLRRARPSICTKRRCMSGPATTIWSSATTSRKFITISVAAITTTAF